MLTIMTIMMSPCITTLVITKSSYLRNIHHTLVSTYRKKTWTTIKQTTRRTQSWRRNRSFIGL